jgi:hypothetical protein
MPEPRTVVGGCARGRGSTIVGLPPGRTVARSEPPTMQVHRSSVRPVRLRLVVVASAGTSAILRQRPR